MAGKHHSEALWTWVIPPSSPLPRGSRSSLRSPAVASCCDVRATLGAGEQASGVTSPTESAWASAQEAEWRPHAGLARLPRPIAWSLGWAAWRLCLPQGCSLIPCWAESGPGCLPGGRWKGLPPPEAWTSAVHRRSASPDPLKWQRPGWPTAFAARRLHRLLPHFEGPPPTYLPLPPKAPPVAASPPIPGCPEVAFSDFFFLTVLGLCCCSGFSLWRLHLLQSTGPRACGRSSCDSQALEHRLNSCGALA